MLCNSPTVEVSEELGEGGGLVVGIEAARVGKYPGVAAAEGVFLQADAGVFVAGDNAVGTDANEGDDGGTPAIDFGFQTLAAGAKFVDRKFIGTSGSTSDNISDTELEIEQQGTLKRREETRRETAVVESGPEAVARATEVTADGGCIEAGIDAGEENDEVFGDKIRYALIGRGEELGFCGFPRYGQRPIHHAVSASPSPWNEARNTGFHNRIKLTRNWMPSLISLMASSGMVDTS